MRIYSAPGVEANTVAGGKLDSYINLPVGTYPTVIVAYDNCGGVATADVTVTTTSETTPGGFVYTVNSNWSADNKTNTLNFVMGFTIVAGDGSLALTGQDPVKTNIDPLSVAPDYGGYRLYVGDYVSGDVFAYFVHRFPIGVRETAVVEQIDQTPSSLLIQCGFGGQVRICI